ncbi:MAG: single-stranded-DNA-specific exonuclease RecJ [Merismopedia sp. SIO2A8]|nr:single-stranded-DNA-specific exonuclease RecJ [Merismopedia sp. SIO2A8]
MDQTGDNDIRLSTNVLWWQLAVLDSSSPSSLASRQPQSTQCPPETDSLQTGSPPSNSPQQANSPQPTGASRQIGSQQQASSPPKTGSPPQIGSPPKTDSSQAKEAIQAVPVKQCLSKPSQPTISPSSSVPNFPSQRWHIAPRQEAQVNAIAQATQLSPLLAQVLFNRGLTTPEMAQLFLHPDWVELPSPLEDFADLSKAVAYLKEAIATGQKMAICGDYDADGMTSTALLIRALRALGGVVDYAIPSRMTDGYGINERIVDAFHRQDVHIILTVDNGIAAVAPITRAVELGMVVIVTDHHDLPATLPPAQAILNPKLIAETSPYRGLAGVGVAYILALELARNCNLDSSLTHPGEDVAHSPLGYTLLDLFTLGTIADLAPLTGVNRRWVQQGLCHLPKSSIEGVKALIQVAGLADEKKGLKPEAIGFRLGPRINAVGRIADPVTVIELLTTDDPSIALDQAMACEKINKDRRRMCEVIEQEAIALINRTRPNLQQERILVVVQAGWHHGVIGIVASRLVERYGVPVFIGTYEDTDPTMIRGSARSIPEFNVHKALVFCHPCLGKYGGHRAAGGFTLKATQLATFHQRLQLFANMYLLLGHLRPLVQVDVQANFPELTHDLYDQIDQLHPCGIGNSDPIFWTSNVQILEQKTVAKERDHLKLLVQQDGLKNDRLKAIAWRWGRYFPLPNAVDIAYQLKLNEWRGETTVELDIVGVRHPSDTNANASSTTLDPDHQSAQAGVLTQSLKPICFQYRKRQYACSVGLVKGDAENASGISTDTMSQQLELRIRNPEGKVLAIQPHYHQALVGQSRQTAVSVDIAHPHYFHLIKAALNALEASLNKC